MQAQNMPTRLISEQTRERQTSINLPKMILLCTILFSLKEGMAEVVQKWCHTKNSASPKTKTNQKNLCRLNTKSLWKHSQRNSCLWFQSLIVWCKSNLNFLMHINTVVSVMYHIKLKWEYNEYIETVILNHSDFCLRNVIFFFNYRSLCFIKHNKTNF